MTDQDRVESGLDRTGKPSSHPIVDFTDADLRALLGRAVRVTAPLGVLLSIVLWIGMGWRGAALFAVGAAISVASIFEWGRLIRLFNAALDQQRTPRGSSLVATFFLLRLILFGGVIYGSLKCFQASPMLLIAGLALAVVGLTWEALRQLQS